MVLARNLIEKKRATTRCSSSNKEDTPCRGGSQSTDLSSSSSSLINLIINKQTKDFRKLNKPGPKTRRSKTRKPKYLSLRLQFSTDKTKSQESSETPISTITATSSTDHHPQLNLFPLHPENLVDDKEAHDENNMAYLFSAADGGATTLTGLLGTSSNSAISDEDNKDHNSTSSLSPSASLTYAAYGRRDREEEVALVRTAIRNKEREPSEERWVHYSEVVERPRDEEVSSCGADRRPYQWKNQRLSLKLDYEEILNAWSDKGPLYIHAAAAAPQSLQVVPDIHDHHFLASEISNGMISDGWGNNGGCVWRVPELMTSKGNDEQDLRLVKVKMEEQQELVAVGRREASVQRYKEKRQNRLFSKRIRYQVRKQNAEKRPRLKGRFVKRS